MKKFSEKTAMLSVMLLMFFTMGITTYAGTTGENGQSAKIFDLLGEEFSGYGTDIKEWLSEELSKEENAELVEDVIGFIREKLEAGELETEEDISNAIQEGEEKFDVNLTEAEKEKIMQLMQKIKELGLNPEKLLEQAQRLYGQFGDELVENTEETIKKSVGNSIAGFFKDMGNRVKGFFSNIFS